MKPRPMIMSYVGKDMSCSFMCRVSQGLIRIGRGGTAGCVLAARLAEDQNASVLLIEAGKLNTEVPASSMPGG